MLSLNYEAYYVFEINEIWQILSRYYGNQLHNKREGCLLLTKFLIAFLWELHGLCN